MYSLQYIVVDNNNIVIYNSYNNRPQGCMCYNNHYITVYHYTTYDTEEIYIYI